MTAREHRKNAFSALKGQLIPVLICVVIYEAIIFGLSIIPAFGGLILLLGQGPLAAGISYVALQTIRRQSVTINSLFVGLRNILNFFLLDLLNTIFIFLWSLLFFIPGIMKAYSYSMSIFILLDNPGMDQESARRQSMNMMEGHRMELFLLHLSFIGWIIIMMLISGLIIVPFAYLLESNPYLYTIIVCASGIIPMVLLFPYMLTATASFYQQLIGDNDVFMQEDEFREKRRSRSRVSSQDDYYDDDEF